MERQPLQLFSLTRNRENLKRWLTWPVDHEALVVDHTA